MIFILIFWADVQMGLDPPLPPSTCVHLILTPPPPFGRHKWMAPNSKNIALYGQATLPNSSQWLHVQCTVLLVCIKTFPTPVSPRKVLGTDRFILIYFDQFHLTQLLH